VAAWHTHATQHLVHVPSQPRVLAHQQRGIGSSQCLQGQSSSIEAIDAAVHSIDSIHAIDRALLLWVAGNGAAACTYATSNRSQLPHISKQVMHSFHLQVIHHVLSLSWLVLLT
jgi:hypothetical protein